MDIVLFSTLAWAIAQGTKILIRLRIKRAVSWRDLTASGGFPSAHSAFVTCLMVQIGFVEGFRSSIFALAFGFWVVVIYDSFNVRYAVGEQAQALNKMREEWAESLGQEYKPIREILGHTPLQVVCGTIVGLIIALLRIQFVPFIGGDLLIGL